MAAVVLGSNIASLNAQRRFNEATASLAHSFEHLSSGLRIVHAGDDAAGLAISSGINADARVYTQGIRNINDSISALSVAEGATTQLSTVLGRLAELAEQSSNGVLSNTQRVALDKESRSLISEYNRIVNTTNFNGLNLTNTKNQSITTQLGYGASGGLTFQLTSDGMLAPDGTFTPVATYSFGGAGYLAFGDFNGDGIRDAVGSDAVSSKYLISLGNSDGSFGAPVTFQESGSNLNTRVGDFNGDGRLDVVSIDFGAGFRAEISLGNGDGTLKAANYYGGLSSGANFAVGDVNGDGRDDISLNADSAGNFIMLANSDGSFLAPVNYQPYWFQQNSETQLIDINADGKLDALSSAFLVGGLSVNLGNGDGTFQLPVLYPTPVSGAGRLATGDFNEDGKVDAIAYLGSMSFFAGKGDGTFQSGISSTGPTGNVSVADVNADGHLDLVSTGAVITVAYGNGNGTFQTFVTASPGAASSGLAARDFDKNGSTDFVGLSSGLLYNFSGNRSLTELLPVFSIATQSDALIAIGTVKSAIESTELNQSVIGASQSRLSFAAATLSIAAENYKQAASLITDVDVAQESAQLVRLQILQKGAQGVLAHANLLPSLALELLKP